MISGADDRLAFVITTEAQLDGIVAARAQVTGLGVDSERSAVQMALASRASAEATAAQYSPMAKILATKNLLNEAEDKGAKVSAGAAATTIASTRNLGMWSALQAESAGHVGKHTLAIGQMERRLATTAEEMLGVNKAVGLMGTSLLKFGIGSIETVAILAGIAAISYAYHKLTDEANAGAKRLEEAQLQNLKNIGIGSMATSLAGIRTARDQAIEDATKAADAGFFTRLKNMTSADLSTVRGRATAVGGGADFTELDRLNKLNEAASKIALEQSRAERLRLLSLSDQVNFQIRSNDLELEGKHRVEGVLDVYKQQVSALYAQIDVKKESIKKEFEIRDAAGHILPLNDEQIRQRKVLIAQADELARIQLNEMIRARELADIAYHRASQVAAASTHLGGRDVKAEYDAQVEEIKSAAKEELEKYPQRKVDIEAQTQAKIRALRRQTQQQAIDDAKTIVGVLVDSGSRQVRAVGHAADTVRRVLIGAQAAHAAVESAIEGGKAIGALATGNFSGAALHAASALELAKAAALGAQESLGGGRGASGSAGAGAGSASTFEPRSGTEGQGSLVVNLYSNNPYGPEQIQQVQYLLNRADILKRPAAIQIAPTNGLRAA